jgi:membrane-associated phospholipid phosphatase
MTSVARWVSIVFHPFVTTLVLAGGVEMRRGPAAATRGVAAVAILFILPLALLTVRQVRSGAWATVDASHRRDRPVLYAVGGGALLALIGYLAVAHPGSPMLRGAAGTLGMLAACALATVWVKVSLHMAVAALAAAVLVTLGSPAGWVLLAAIPLLAWSRVALGRHRPIEVIVGGAIGAVSGILLARIG